MHYISRIEELITKISTDFVDFDEELTHGRIPTQVSSEFLTNKEQGDWAEETLLRGINNNSEKYIAVRYGRDDNIAAGEEGFKEFYEEYRNELDEIGKRPDILIFDKNDFPYNENSVSKFPREILDELVPKAKCGIEVRSSAFLIDRYERSMNEKQQHYIEEAMRMKNVILSEYGNLLKTKDEELYKIIKSISVDNLHIISFKKTSWRSTKELSDMSALLRELKQTISQISAKRKFLSITPKTEDLKVVYRWIKKYNVPHYYIQVFFDKAYGISFENILELLGTPELEGEKYFIETDIKNQNKTTIKIDAKDKYNILEKINLPEHFSEKKEFKSGRLLYYVRFKGSEAVLNADGFEKLFGFEL